MWGGGGEHEQKGEWGTCVGSGKGLWYRNKAFGMKSYGKACATQQHNMHFTTVYCHTKPTPNPQHVPLAYLTLCVQSQCTAPKMVALLCHAAGPSPAYHTGARLKAVPSKGWTAATGMTQSINNKVLSRPPPISSRRGSKLSPTGNKRDTMGI